ncbi:MAG: tRNA (adenosine(37)-N6)-threonylcarbamoyltransferase complex dimerization subunit type 1 TsaB [Patescibacteria group bacterium]|jgi:tRNA threonylcarbamoyladenosine biosynthesis protein TsaB
MILVIHTADQKQVFVGLIKSGKLIAKKEFLAPYQQAEKLLSAIGNLLKAKSYQLQAINGIAVVSGPGPFTALRIGVTTANTLAWALGIPIVGIKLNEFHNLSQLVAVIEKKIKKASVGKIIEPFYDKEPNITKRHSK